MPNTNSQNDSDKGPSKPSMRDFDYFDEDAQPASAEDIDALADGFGDQVARYRARQRKMGRYLVLAVLAFGALLWWLSDYREEIAYAFAESSEPLQIGDVTTVRPEDIPHGEYVELVGVTEHRGLKRQIVRGLSLNRQEYWYFRLVGSRGVFIEVSPNPDKYGFHTQVRVRGRAIDPRQSVTYATFVNSYEDRFHPQERDTLRVIQAGVKPGEGKTPYIIAFGVVFAIAAFNLVVLVRLVRMRRQLPGAR